MIITSFIWLADIVQKLIWKHDVEIEDMKEIFEIGPRYHFVEKGERKGEDVYSASGQTEAGRYLICYFIFKGDRRDLVLSAPDMTRSERKRYAKK